MYLNFTEPGCAKEPRSVLQRHPTMKFLMRVGLFYIFLVMVSGQLLLAHSGRSQTLDSIHVTVELRNENLKHLFRKIEKQTGLMFAYQPQQVDGYKRINLPMQTRSVKATLDLVLEGTLLEYRQVNNNVIIFSEEEKKFLLTETETLLINITGTVSDSGGDPMPGVNIIVKGTTIGTNTDSEGKYVLEVLEQDAILVFSFIGYVSQEIPVNNRSVIDVSLSEDVQSLEEVVIIGYGEQKKSNLTAAVQMVDTRDLQNRPVKSVAEMLTASVPNLNVTINSSAPNAEPSLNIRGFTEFNASGSPLVLVDGVPMDIKYVNANDVESISVLKDAAASAIYGSRAPNGVILITTKAGAKGEAMRIDVSADLFISEPIGLPKSASSADFAINNNERAYNRQAAPLYTDAVIERMRQFMNGEITTTNIILPNGKYGGVYDFNANSDHLDLAFRDRVTNQRYNVSVSGGGDKTSYYASLGYLGNDGVYASDHDWLKRISTVVKVNTEITDWLNFGVNVKYNRQETTRPTIWNGGQNDTRFINQLTWLPPVPAYNDNGSPNEFSILPNLDGLSGSFNNVSDDLWSMYNVEFKPLKGLSIKADYAWNMNQGFDNNTELVFYGFDADGAIMPSRRSPGQDKIFQRSSTLNYHNANVNISYTKTLGKHDFSVLAGYNEELTKFNSLAGSNTDLYTQSTPSISTTYGSNTFLDDNAYSWATRGYFFRASYNYKGIYLVDFNGRYDASSKYSPDSRWAMFPSVSAGYNIAKENYWPLKEWVSVFKVRGSWGKLGNNTGPNYSYLPTLGTNAQSNIILEGERLPYVTMPGIISDDLTWTKPRVIGFGLEVEALQSRLSMEYDWYQRTVFDQQGPAEQYSEVLGTNPPTRNNAISETRGWEFLVTWEDEAFNLSGSPVRYGIRAGLSDYIGYVVEYVSNETGTRAGWTPGQVFGELYGYRSLGMAENAEFLQANPLWTSDWFYPGDLMFEDVNGDGVVNEGVGNYWYSQGDRQLLGYNYPRYRFNIATNVAWKGFTLSALFDGVGKQKAYFGNQFNFGSGAYVSQGQIDRGYWTFNRPDAFFPRAKGALGPLAEENDQYAMNLAHLRTRNINLNYEFPSYLLEKIKIRRLSANISIENAGMVYYNSWFKEMDPIQVQQGMTNYPPSKTYSLGLKLGI